MHVLVVDDEVDIAASVVDFFELTGYSADYAHNAASMIALVQANDYDLILLDVMMPGESGLQACEILRQTLHSQVPVLFLTALDTLEDKLAGFAVGGDDYLLKPFEMVELLARARALASRGGRADVGTLDIGDLRIHVQAQAVLRQGRSIKLNRLQFKILWLLARKHPQVLSREALERAVWGDDPPDSDVLKTQIYQLRQQLDKPFDTALLHTVHGVGYKLDLKS